MTIRFRSQITGNIIMLTDDAHRLLEILGKQPSRIGIIQSDEMEGAIAALERAGTRLGMAQPANQDRGNEESDEARSEVSIRQRTFPLLEMLRRCRQAGESVVWEA